MYSPTGTILGRSCQSFGNQETSPGSCQYQLLPGEAWDEVAPWVAESMRNNTASDVVQKVPTMPEATPNTRTSSEQQLKATVGARLEASQTRHERAVKRFYCACGRSYIWKDNLKRHQRRCKNTFCPPLFYSHGSNLIRWAFQACRKFVAFEVRSLSHERRHSPSEHVPAEPASRHIPSSLNLDIQLGGTALKTEYAPTGGPRDLERAYPADGNAFHIRANHRNGQEDHFIPVQDPSPRPEGNALSCLSGPINCYSPMTTLLSVSEVPQMDVQGTEVIPCATTEKQDTRTLPQYEERDDPSYLFPLSGYTSGGYRDALAAAKKFHRC